MKKALLYFLLCILVSGIQKAKAQTWTPVGSIGFSAAEADYESIALDNKGTPYVVYQDDANSFSATVMKYNCSNWVAVGAAGFSGNVANFTSLTIDNNGIPYVVYQDGANTQKATVMKYIDSTWTAVGSPGFSAGIVGYTTIAMDTSGIPYVAFQDDSFPVGDGGPVSVMKYNGSSWVYVGHPRFTPLTNFISMAMSGSTPYIAYQDPNYSLSVTVVKYNGSSWVIVGSPGFTDAQADNVSLAINNEGTPYVTYMDYGRSSKASVMKYNGTSWVTVGSTGFSKGIVSSPTIAIAKSGTPYVVYADDSTADNYATVMKYNGSDWVTEGSAGFSGTLTNYPGIVIDNNGTPYVCYQGFSGGRKATVRKLDTATTAVAAIGDNTAASFALFPNPVTDQFTVTATDNINSIVITNILGQTVYTHNYNAHQVQVDAATLPAGIYLVKVNNLELKKFVKE